MPPVERRVWNEIRDEQQQGDLKGAVVIFVFKPDGEPRRVTFLKKFKGNEDEMETVGMLDTLKGQIIGDTLLDEWTPDGQP